MFLIPLSDMLKEKMETSEDAADRETEPQLDGAGVTVRELCFWKRNNAHN